MIAKSLIEEKPVSNSEAKAVLDKLSKTGKELNYEQRIAAEYLAKFPGLSITKSKKLIEELLELNQKIKPDLAVKIADLLPKDEEDVRAIFTKERFTLTKEEIKAILELVQK
ncbi:RNA polymerase Rpb4 family protein [archaeon]|nr:RNA polymerase Rpb4 family protein [archaeon]